MKVTAPARVVKKWRPKKWRPEYDRVVAYSAMGKSNIWIAQQLSFTKEHVSTILNQPQAIELIGRLQAKLQDNMMVSIPQALSEIADKAVLRLKEVMFDDKLFSKNPFAVVDRGMDVLKGLQHLKGGGNGAPQQGNVYNINTAILAPHQRSDILEGLEKVQEVNRLHKIAAGGE